MMKIAFKKYFSTHIVSKKYCLCLRKSVLNALNLSILSTILVLASFGIVDKC